MLNTDTYIMKYWKLFLFLRSQWIPRKRFLPLGGNDVELDYDDEDYE